jgi:hypothetical protein
MHTISHPQHGYNAQKKKIFIYFVIRNKEKRWVGKKINVTSIKLISNFIKLTLNLNHLVGGISPM